MCLFCKIVNKEIPSKIVLEDDDLVAFHDIHPQAPIHVLVIPKKHIRGVSDATPEDGALLGKVLLAAQRIAEMTGVAQSGFRLIVNSGSNAGQLVQHLHVHVLGGRLLGWPPG